PASHATPGTTQAPPTTQKTGSLPLPLHPRDTASPHRSRIHRLLLPAFREHRALGEAHPPSRPPPSPRLETGLVLVLRVPQEAVLRHRARPDTIRSPGNHRQFHRREFHRPTTLSGRLTERETIRLHTRLTRLLTTPPMPVIRTACAARFQLTRHQTPPATHDPQAAQSTTTAPESSSGTWLLPSPPGADGPQAAHYEPAPTPEHA